MKQGTANMIKASKTDMTFSQAQGLLSIFQHDPAMAHSRGEGALTLYFEAFERLNPHAYIQVTGEAGRPEYTICFRGPASKMKPW